MAGKIKLGAVDCDQNSSICSGIKGYPTFKIHPVEPSSGKRNSPIPYEGGREAKEFASKTLIYLPKFALKFVKSVQDLHQSPKNSNFVKFVVFSEKKIPGDLFYGLSAEFSDHLFLFCPVYPNSPSYEICKTYHESFSLTKYPSMIAFTNSAKNPRILDEISPDDAYKQIYSFIKTTITPQKIPSILEIGDQSQLDLIMERKNFKIFLFSFVEPEFEESKIEFEKNMNIFKEGISLLNSENTVFEYYWINTLKHVGLQKFFKLSSSYPIILFIDAQKQVYCQSLNTFDAAGISKFLKNCQKYDIPYLPYSVKPKLFLDMHLREENIEL